MSREIRFRCWNNCLRKYIPEDELMDSFGECLKEKHLYIEQYTGLTDKNGKEIYEGDIIQEEIDCGDDDIDGVYRYKVIWDEETSCWSLFPNYGTIHKDLWETNQSIEVIGNIHENPELIGGEE